MMHLVVCFSYISYNSVLFPLCLVITVYAGVGQQVAEPFVQGGDPFFNQITTGLDVLANSMCLLQYILLVNVCLSVNYVSIFSYGGLSDTNPVLNKTSVTERDDMMSSMSDIDADIASLTSRSSAQSSSLSTIGTNLDSIIADCNTGGYPASLCNSIPPSSSLPASFDFGSSVRLCRKTFASQLILWLK